MKEIQLTQGKVTLVDDQDFDFLNQWKWFAHRDRNTFYAERAVCPNGRKYQKTLLMHRVILGVPANLQTDHVDGNGLNNSRANLRICTNQENQRNRIAQPNTTSRFKGVAFHKSTGKWQSFIVVNKKSHYLGLFDSEVEAAHAYNEAAQQLFGEFAKLNTGMEA